MKIDLGVLSTKEVETTNDEQIKMRLSDDAATIVFQMFTKNIYSNPIGTIVREITSNCFDSHIEANVTNKPVIIRKSFDKQANTHYISFIDFGVGMSPQRIKEIYSVYFESTKRDDNNQIGGYGIGAKSVLAYRRLTGHGESEYDNSFYIITTYNKIKYFYCIYEGNESPIISLLHSETTTDRNGTEIKVPVLQKDLETFEREMVKQLYYFENIIFEGFDPGNSWNIKPTNDYQIIKAKNFYYRGNDYLRYIHVCLGKVAYPIDYNVLNLNQSEYYLPIAIKFNVGDIKVTVSREQLDYDENTIKLIKKKLIEVKEEIIEMLNKQHENIVTLKDFFEYIHEYNTLKFSNKMSLKVQGLVKKNEINLTNFRYKELNINAFTNDVQLFKFFFNIKRLGDKPKRYSEFNGNYNTLNEFNLYYVEDKFNRKMIKSSYIKSIHSIYYLITKKDILLRPYDISNVFNVVLKSTTDEKGKPIKFMKTLLKLQEEYFNIVRENATNYDTLEVPNDFVIERQKNKQKINLNGVSIPVTFYGKYRSNYKLNLNNLLKFKGKIFYATPNEEYLLNNSQKLYRILFADNVVWDYDSYSKIFRNNLTNINGGIMFIRVAQSNIKYMKEIKNAFHINQFKHKILYRKEEAIIKYLQSNELINKYNNLDSFYKRRDFDLINKKWGKVINEVNEYLSEVENNANLKYHIQELKDFFEIDNVEKTTKQKNILNKLIQLKKLEENNTNILCYFNSYKLSYKFENTLIDILKKIMKF